MYVQTYPGGRVFYLISTLSLLRMSGVDNWNSLDFPHTALSIGQTRYLSAGLPLLSNPKESEHVTPCRRELHRALWKSLSSQQAAVVWVTASVMQYFLSGLDKQVLQPVNLAAAVVTLGAVLSFNLLYDQLWRPAMTFK